MFQLLDKVKSNVSLCGIEISFSGYSVPSIIESWQPFYNETFEDENFEKLASTISSIFFSEESAVKNGNVFYKQKISFRFPSNDKNRANRIALLQKIKYIKANQADGKDIVIGRNDIKQNTLPNIAIQSNTRTTQVDVTVQSISPAGFTPNINQYVIVPLTLFP